jgi:uncharacterized protein YcbK (DUF882 family)
MSTVKIFAKGSKVQLTKNFNSNEFDCKCKRPTCKQTLIDMEHVLNMQALRDRVGKAITQTCAYRCPEHNKEVGGASGSQHLKGYASDIVIQGMTPNEVAALAEPIFNGLGRYDTFTHVDSRDMLQKGAKARWDFRTKK